MARKQLLIFVACILIVVMSAGCAACSTGAKNGAKTSAKAADPDVSVTAEATEMETEMTEESTAGTTRETAKETTVATTAPSQEESAAAVTSDISDASDAPAITPPAERVYPITSEDAVAVFEALGLSSTEMSPEDDVIEKQINALDPANKYLCVYFSFTKESYAMNYLKLVQDTFTNGDIGSFEGDADITGEDGYSKLVVNGSYENDAHIYVVAICVDKVVMTGYTISDKEQDKQFIDSCFIALGYM